MGGGGGVGEGAGESIAVVEGGAVSEMREGGRESMRACVSRDPDHPPPPTPRTNKQTTHPRPYTDTLSNNQPPPDKTKKPTKHTVRTASAPPGRPAPRR